VRALIDAEVLQVDVRPGEFVGAPPGEPLIVLGGVRELHVRVDIDEFDIPRFRLGARAGLGPFAKATGARHVVRGTTRDLTGGAS